MTEIKWTEEELKNWVHLLKKRAPTLERINARERDKKHAAFYQELLEKQMAARKRTEKVKANGIKKDKATD